MKKVEKEETTMPIPPSPQMFPDNDQRNNRRFWIGGIFYANPNDPRIVVEKRSGLGWTLNLAHPVGWVLLACTVLIIALLLLLRSGML